MAKETGLGAELYLDGIDISDDTREMTRISKGINTIGMTGIRKLAMERKAGSLTGELSWISFFNPTNAHLALEDLPRVDRLASYFHRAELGAPVASILGKQINYDPKRTNTGELTAAVQIRENGCWLDWCRALTPGSRTDAGATNGTGVDFTSGANFGLQGYLHVSAFTGTSATIKLQESSDNGGADAWTDVVGGAFTVVAGAPTFERIATARNLAVERYLRVVTTGVFSNLVFIVSVMINRTEYTI